jgi:hypothetical protein
MVSLLSRETGPPMHHKLQPEKDDALFYQHQEQILTFHRQQSTEHVLFGKSF